VASDNITGDLRPVGSSFQLQIVKDDGTDVTHFSRAYTIRIYYEHSIIQGLNEHSLTLYYWDLITGRWQALTGTLDVDGNALTISLDHMTRFMVLGKQWQTYIPSIGK
jgi:hypothetical protein